MAVTCLRSLAIGLESGVSLAGAGSGIWGSGFWGCFKSWPQASQNLAPGGRDFSQPGHLIPSSAPHSRQKTFPHAKTPSRKEKKAFRTHLKNRILVQDCGGAELPRFAGLPA
jgi:hypothetical protein